MSRFLVEFNKSYRSKSKFTVCWTMLRGNYLVELYLFIKAMYIANVLGQLFLLNAFLGNEYHLYGIDVLKRLLANQPWTTSHRFPRVTICDFHIRMLGNSHRHTIQCALPMNLFYEIIFIFFWFWFVFVAISTICSLLIWLFTSLFYSYQEAYIRQRLLAMNKISKSQRGQVRSFVTEHLRRDGCFITRLVAKNSSDLIASQLLSGLWEYYLDSVTNKESSKRRDSTSSGSGGEGRAEHNRRMQQEEETVIKRVKS
ncbi:hypothetical protein HELRODRAFT_114074 [Helobdella robusta]|uniref:Innexin n=1 Tax=Helobdella robusta TaxID=6412 RepID=T1EFY8_HELRO|nr:hypothetical protein HELRODRAFT_114074 [Helobdella robusta]ESN97988.1 hypothetical protein HELRODRAFT_114074 [Helobdella robusta]